MFAQLLFGYLNIVDYGIYLHKKIYIYSIIAFFCIVINIILNYYLIQTFSIYGAAITKVLVYFLISFITYLFANKYYKLMIETERLIFPILFVVVCYIITNIHTEIIIVRIYERIILFLIALILFFKFWLDIKEKKYIEVKYSKLQKINLAHQEEIEQSLINSFRSEWYILCDSVQRVEIIFADYCGISAINHFSN